MCDRVYRFFFAWYPYVWQVILFVLRNGYVLYILNCKEKMGMLLYLTVHIMHVNTDFCFRLTI
jgi:hypothetical protein